MKSIFELTMKRIYELAALEKKPLFGMMNHLTSEVGELAEAVEVHEGFSTKVMKEPMVGEVADVIQCALAVFARATPEMTAEERTALLEKHLCTKTDKWQHNLVPAWPTPAPPKDKVIVRDVGAVKMGGPDAPYRKEANQNVKRSMAEAYAAMGFIPSKPAHDENWKAVHDRLVKIFAEQLGIDGVVNQNQRFVADLGADSLDLIELLMAVEDEYGLEFSDEENDEAESCITVADAIDFTVQILKDRGLELSNGRVYVQIRKHPSGMHQPTGRRRVYRMELNKNGTLEVGIGKNGAWGWTVNPAAGTPSFLTFRLHSENGPTATLQEAWEYWKRHNP